MQPVHRLAEPAPLEVPERAIDSADREHGVALPAMHHDAVHLVPQQLGRDRILSHDDGAEPGRDDGGDALGHRAGDAGHPLVGLDLHEHGLDAEPAGIELHPALMVGAGAVFGIDVDRADQPLLPERALGRHGPAHPAQLDSGDLQDVPLPMGAGPRPLVDPDPALAYRNAA